MNPLRQPRTLDDLMNFRLHRLFALSSAPIVRLLEGRHGVTRREWRLVALLASRGPLSPSDLATHGRLDRARTSRAIGALVEKQLVLRQALTADPRRARVSLTPAGERLYAEVFPVVSDVNTQLLSALDDAQLDALDAALQRLTERALALNQTLATDLKASRREGGTRRLRTPPPPESPQRTEPDTP